MAKQNAIDISFNQILTFCVELTVVKPDGEEC